MTRFLQAPQQLGTQAVAAADPLDRLTTTIVHLAATAVGVPAEQCRELWARVLRDPESGRWQTIDILAGSLDPNLA